MTEEEMEKYDAFMVKALYALQEQINEQEIMIQAHEERLHVLERQDMWNLYQEVTTPAPKDDMVVRLACGRLALNERVEAEETND